MLVHVVSLRGEQGRKATYVHGVATGGNFACVAFGESLRGGQYWVVWCLEYVS